VGAIKARPNYASILHFVDHAVVTLDGHAACFSGCGLVRERDNAATVSIDQALNPIDQFSKSSVQMRMNSTNPSRARQTRLPLELGRYPLEIGSGRSLIPPHAEIATLHFGPVFDNLALPPLLVRDSAARGA
jgi:hypothetical protein